GGDGDGVRATKKPTQINLKTAHGANGRPGDSRGLVFRKDDRMLRADATAGRTTTLAIVLIFNQNTLVLIHSINAEEAKIDALHAICAATVIDHGIPAAIRR